jgi:hypothetical protein
MVISNDIHTAVSLFTGLQSVNSWQGVGGEAKVSFNVQIVPNFSLRLKLVRAKLRPAGPNLTEEWQQMANVKDSKLSEGQGTD